MHVRRAILGIAVLMWTGSLAAADVAPDPVRPPPPRPEAAKVVESGYKVVEVAKGLNRPWSLAFLPDGAILVTERIGRLRIIRNGTLQAAPIAGVPGVHTQTLDDFYQAGLFEVMLHPKYVENNFVYLTYAWGTSSENTLRLARAHFDGTSLKDLRVLFEVKPRRDTSNHYGGKMAFLPDGTLLLSVGEAFEYREKAQDLSAHFGKIIRLNDDGQVPADNPFAGREGARPEIFSLGHRNPQGLVFDAQRGTIYATEHGPQGGDEINIIEAGKNYGWPVITYGMDYSGAYVSPYTQRPGMEQPVLLWTPSMAPSGLAVYRGDKFPAWKGDLFVGSLAHKHLRRVHLDANGNVAGQEILMSSLKSRVREVREGPDGFLYVTTDERDNRGATGRVLRLEPGP